MGYLIGERMAMFHIPKTGGLWARHICNMVGQPWTRFGPDGMPGDQHSDEMPPSWRMTMAFVRHPVDWLRSFWCFHQKTGWRQYTDAPAFVFYACHRPGESFQRFVTRYLENMPGAVGRMFERYTQGANLIGHTETLGTDLADFLHEGAGVAKAKTEKIVAATPRMNTTPLALKREARLIGDLRHEVLVAEADWMWTWEYRDE